MKINKFESSVSIKNRKASFNYELLEKYTAGMVLKGTEIKSIRLSKASIGESYCYIDRGEIFVKNLQINEYSHGTASNHAPLRVRKLLLSKKEIKKLENALKDKGLTIVVRRLWLSSKGWAKLDIALARGKKLHDKRDSIKKRDVERELSRKF